MGVQQAITSKAFTSILGSVVKAAVPALIGGISKKDKSKVPEAAKIEQKDEATERIREEEEKLRSLRRRRRTGSSSSLLALSGPAQTRSTSLLGG